MKNILNFNRIGFFPIWIFSFYYFPQTFVGILSHDYFFAIKLAGVATFAICSYLFFYLYVFTKKSISHFVNNPQRITTNSDKFAFLIFGFYSILIFYVSMTVEVIPLFAMMNGASIDDLSRARELFLRSRSGWETVLPYLNAVFIMALIPYSLTTLFYQKSKYKFYFLFYFLLCLSLTLEKSVAAIALIPIIILHANSIDKTKYIRWLVFLVSMILIISFFSRGGLQSEENAMQKQNAATIPESHQLIKCDNQVCYLINRIVWIPYVTAIDWLKYQDDILNGDYVWGKSIGAVASLLGENKINLEREVFAYQWGQNESETGSSNTTYFIDAFVNFSWIGVFIYSIILAFIIKILAVSDNIPIKCTAYISLFYIGVNSLPPMLLSGGLIFILFIAIFFKQQLVKSKV